MLELAPGVYTSPYMTRGVRERVWSVLAEWFQEDPRGSVVMTWKEKGAPGGQAIQNLGVPPKSLAFVDGVALVRRELTPEEFASLEKSIGESRSMDPSSEAGG